MLPGSTGHFHVGRFRSIAHHSTCYMCDGLEWAMESVVGLQFVLFFEGRFLGGNGGSEGRIQEPRNVREHPTMPFISCDCRGCLCVLFVFVPYYRALFGF